MSQERIPSFAYTIAAWVLTGVALALILLLHLLPALLAGMLVYELVHLMEPAIHKRFPERRETLIAVGLLSSTAMREAFRHFWQRWQRSSRARRRRCRSGWSGKCRLIQTMSRKRRSSGCAPTRRPCS